MVAYIVTLSAFLGGLLAIAALNAIGVCGAAVWIYNRSFAYLHESTLKKCIALLSLPFGCVVGVAMLLSLRIPEMIVPNAIAWTLAAATLVNVNRQRRAWVLDSARSRSREAKVRKGADIAWEALSTPERLVLRLLSPINRPTALRTKTYRVRIPDLPAEFEGLRVVHLSDFHIHRTLTEEYYRSSVDAANALRPDLILLGGDYVTREAHVGRIAKLLGGLRAPLGILAIRGNHDYWTRPDEIARELESIGARILRNEVATVRRGSAELRILGLETPWLPLGRAGRAELAQAGRPHLAIVHTPDCFPEARELGAPVAIAGHTHGGQVRLPYFGTTLSATRMGPAFGLGSTRLGGMLAITSAGVGSFVPLRVLCPPEVLLLLLTRG